MGSGMPNELFRKKAMESISSPDKLTDYLRVTNPGVWVILAATLLLLGGLFAWSAVGTIQTTEDAKVVVKNGTATITPEGEPKSVKVGMTLRIDSQTEVISSTQKDEIGETVFIAQVSLPDGVYKADIITEEVHPIQFLLQSN